MSRVLFDLLVLLLLSANAPIVVVVADKLERRRGAKIKAKDVFCDAISIILKTCIKPLAF